MQDNLENSGSCSILNLRVMQNGRHPAISGAIFPTHIGFLLQVGQQRRTKLAEIRHAYSVPLADVGYFTRKLFDIFG